MLRAHALARPDGYALRDTRVRLTWSALAQWVDRIAAELHSAGLKRGQRVSVWLPNCAEVVAVFLACSRNGYVCNPSLHQNYTVANIVQLVERIQSAAIFARAGYGSDAARADIFAAVGGLACVKRVYAVEPSGVVPPGAWACPAPESAAPDALPPADDNPDK